MVGYATNAVATSLSFSNWMAHQHPTSLFSLLLLETVTPFSFPRSALYWCAFKPAGNSFPAPLVSSAYYPLSPIGSWLPNLCLQLWPHHRTLDSNIQTHKKMSSPRYLQIIANVDFPKQNEGLLPKLSLLQCFLLFLLSAQAENWDIILDSSLPRIPLSINCQ